MKSKGSKVRWMLAGVSALVAASAAPRPAEACGGEWFPVVEVDHRPMGVARAEKAMEKGKTAAAAGMIVRMMPHIKSLKAEKATIVARAQRVLALATARSDGALKIKNELPSHVQGTWLGTDAKARSANLDWSVQAMRSVAKTKKQDPAAETDLAEVLSHVKAHEGEARQILERLAKKDLIATPEGYAVLARLRDKAGDAKGKKLALKRCQAMAEQTSQCSASQRG